MGRSERIAKRLARHACLVAALQAGGAWANASVDALTLSGDADWPGWISVSAYVSYGTSVDCSPPRACYAKSQQIDAAVICIPRAIAVKRRVSMDLNGNVVNVSTGPLPTDGFNRVDEGAEAILLRICGHAPDVDWSDRPMRRVR